LVLAALTFATIESPIATAEPTDPPGGGGDRQALVDSDLDGQPDAPSLRDALAGAGVTGARVEDLSQRTESLRVWANPDATVTQEAYATPRWVSEDGRWVDVDYSLVSDGAGGYVPVHAPTHVVIGGGGPREFATLYLDGGSSTTWSWPEDLPSPVIDGATAVYRVGEGEELLVTASVAGVSARVRLLGPEVVDRGHAIEVRTDGVTLSQTGAGQLLLTDDGEAVGHTATMTAWDGRLDAAGDPLEVVAVDATLTRTRHSDGIADHELVLETPTELASDPDVEYPITIDPDLSSLVAVQDTWIRKDKTSLETSSYRLIVGRTEGADNSNPAVALLQWADGGLANRQIVDADLVLFQYYAASCAASKKMNVHPLAEPWSEAKTKWSNRPSYVMDGAMIATLTANTGGEGCNTPNDFVSVDLTLIAQKWAAGPSHNGFANNGLQLNIPADDADKPSFERRFCSIDFDADHTSCYNALRAPMLSVTYRALLAPTNVSLVNPIQGAPTVVTNRAANRLRATVAMDAGAACQSQTGCLKAVFTVTGGGQTRVITSDSAAQSGGVVGADLPPLAEGSYEVTAVTRNVEFAQADSPATEPYAFVVDLPPAVPQWHWTIDGWAEPAPLPAGVPLSLFVETPTEPPANVSFCVEVTGDDLPMEVCRPATAGGTFIVGGENGFPANASITVSVTLRDSYSTSEASVDTRSVAGF
jgi:hypothetical protein